MHADLNAVSAYLISNGAALLWWRTARACLLSALVAIPTALACDVLEDTLSYGAATHSLTTAWDMTHLCFTGLMYMLWFSLSLLLKSASVGGLPSPRGGRQGGPCAQAAALVGAPHTVHFLLQLALAFTIRFFLVQARGLKGGPGVPPDDAWAHTAPVAAALAVLISTWRWQGGGGIGQTLLAGAPASWLEGGASGSAAGQCCRVGGGPMLVPLARAMGAGECCSPRARLAGRAALREFAAVLVRAPLLALLVLHFAAPLLADTTTQFPLLSSSMECWAVKGTSERLQRLFSYTFTLISHFFLYSVDPLFMFLEKIP